MLFEIGLAALAGAAAKIVDEASEGHRALHPALAGALAILYGATLGWLAVSTPLSSLFIALALASLLAGKIDHPYHILGAGVFALAIGLYPIASFEPWLFCLFLVAGLFDELDLPLGPLRGVGTQRLWTPLSALGVFVAFGQALPGAAIVGFDLAYRTVEWLMRRGGKAPVRARPGGRRRARG